MRKYSALMAIVLFGAAFVSAVPAGARAEHAALVGIHEIRTQAKPGGGVANCSNDGASNGVYSVTGWIVGGETTAHLNTGSVPGALGDVTSVMQASFDAWSGAGTAVPRITVATDGTATRASANHLYELMWGRAGGNTLAVTYTWQWSNGSIESDTVFNRSFTWFNAGSEGDGCYEDQPYYEVRNIATHEFGHTYGLGHPSGDRFETMYAYGYSGETLKWSPANGDVTGIRSLY